MSPLRAILQLFFAKNHHVMTEKLASSYPMRRAAQLVAHAYFRAEGALKKGAARAVEEQPKKSHVHGTNRTSNDSFTSNFRRYLKDEMEEYKRNRK